MISLHRAAFLSLAAVVFAIPWERSIAVPVAGAAGTPFGGVAFMLTVVSIAGAGKLRFRRPALFLVVMALFVFWSAVTYYWSLDPAAVLARTTTYVQLLVMMWLVWQLTRTEQDIRTLMQAYVFGALLAIVVVLFDFATGNALFVSPTTGLARFSFAGNDPNYFALTLVLGIPMAWYLVLRGNHRLLNLVNLAYVPLTLIVVALTGSRGGLVSVVVALAAIPATHAHLRMWQRVALVLALAAAGVAATALVPEATYARFVETPQEIAEGDLTGRTEIWWSGIRYLSEDQRAILIGVGSGNYGHAVERYLGRERTAHNAYLNVLVGNGIVGLLLFLGLFGLVGFSVLSVRGPFRGIASFLLLSLAVGIVALSWEREKTLYLALALLGTRHALTLAPAGQAGGQCLPQGGPGAEFTAGEVGSA